MAHKEQNSTATDAKNAKKVRWPSTEQEKKISMGETRARKHRLGYLLSEMHSHKNEGIRVIEDGRRVVYYCSLCKVWAHSDNTLSDHLKGKKHNVKLSAMVGSSSTSPQKSMQDLKPNNYSSISSTANLPPPPIPQSLMSRRFWNPSPAKVTISPPIAPPRKPGEDFLESVRMEKNRLTGEAMQREVSEAKAEAMDMKQLKVARRATQPAISPDEDATLTSFAWSLYLRNTPRASEGKKKLTKVGGDAVGSRKKRNKLGKQVHAIEADSNPHMNSENDAKNFVQAAEGRKSGPLFHEYWKENLKGNQKVEESGTIGSLKAAVFAVVLFQYDEFVGRSGDWAFSIDREPFFPDHNEQDSDVMIEPVIHFPPKELLTERTRDCKEQSLKQPQLENSLDTEHDLENFISSPTSPIYTPVDNSLRQPGIDPLLERSKDVDEGGLEGEQGGKGRKKRKRESGRGSVSPHRTCFICRRGMKFGEEVGALLNLGTGRLACSSRNKQGMFHVFHSCCIADWTAFCQMREGNVDSPKCPNEKQSVKPISKQQQTTASVCSKNENMGPETGRNELVQNPQPDNAAPNNSDPRLGISHDPVMELMDENSASVRSDPPAGIASQEHQLSLDEWAMEGIPDEEESQHGTTENKIQGPFCPECQGTGVSQPKSKELERPRYRLAQVYEWMLDLAETRKACAKDKKAAFSLLRPRMIKAEALEMQSTCSDANVSEICK